MGCPENISVTYAIQSSINYQGTYPTHILYIIAFYFSIKS